MCKVLTACSIVRYSTAEVRIFKICVQFLLLVVLYGTVLQKLEFLKYVYSSYCLQYCTVLYCRSQNFQNMCTILPACSTVRYCTAAVRTVTICVLFLLLLALHLRNRDCSFNYTYQLWQSNPYLVVIRMQNFAFLFKTDKLYYVDLSCFR